MKLSIFTTISNPEERQDPYNEAIINYLDFADEIVVIDGDEDFGPKNSIFTDGLPTPPEFKFLNYKWNKEFDWKFIGEQFQRGYDACIGDWVIRADLDYFFHEDDLENIRLFLNSCKAPFACMPKRQFILADRYRTKSVIPLAYNKGKYGNRIKLNGGGDLCQPTLDGKELRLCGYGHTDCDIPVISRKEYIIVSDEDQNKVEILDRLPDAHKEGTNTYVQNRGIPFYNYDFTFKTKEIIKKDFARFARAWGKWKGKYEWGGPNDESAFKYFMEMQNGRIRAEGWQTCGIEIHPKYISNKIKNIKPDQLGYNLFGEFRSE